MFEVMNKQSPKVEKESLPVFNHPLVPLVTDKSEGRQRKSFL